MSDERVATAQAMHDRGTSYNAIGRVLGVAHSTVRCWLDPEARAKHIVANARWNATHREEIKVRRTASRATYRASHRKEIKVGQTAYRAAHIEESRAYSAAYNAAHKIERAAQRAKRRALKYGALAGATISQHSEIAEIYHRAKKDSKVRCYLCGKLIPKGHRQVDHITPLSKGGAHRPSNLAVACDTCNLSKNAKLPEEIGVLI